MLVVKRTFWGSGAPVFASRAFSSPGFDSKVGLDGTRIEKFPSSEVRGIQSFDCALARYANAAKIRDKANRFFIKILW
jgi:hypothetical protein